MNFLKSYLKKIGLFKEIVAKCGHETEIKGGVSAFGESGTFTIPKNDDGTFDYCLDCIRKMTIRCAWCGKPIFIGQPVTLYTPADENFQIPEHAVIYKENPLRLVGCLRWNCAQTGADRAGFWIPPGKVYRTLSPIEQCLVSAEEEKQEVIIVGDLHDLKEAMPIED